MSRPTRSPRRPAASDARRAPGARKSDATGPVGSTTDSDVYATLRPLFGLNGRDARVIDFLSKYRAKPPKLEPGSGFAPVDLRSIGVRLLFWVGWGKAAIPNKYSVEPGTLVEAAFLQEGIDRHRRFAGALPRALHVEMTREELEQTLGAPTDACKCGQEPACFLAWHVRGFDGPLVADVTHHAKHAGRTRPRAGRVDISVHLPRAQ